MSSLIVLTKRTLRTWPLPLTNDGGDKEGRGRVLIVGGTQRRRRGGWPGNCARRWP